MYRSGYFEAGDIFTKEARVASSQPINKVDERLSQLKNDNDILKSKFTSNKISVSNLDSEQLNERVKEEDNSNSNLESLYLQGIQDELTDENEHKLKFKHLN